MLARCVEELVGGEWHGCGVEDVAAESDEGDDEDDLKGVGEVIRDLRGCDVEPKEEGECEAEDGGGSDERIDADEESGGEAPGKLLGGGSAAQESEDGKSDAAIGPIVARALWLDYILGHI